MKRVTPHRSFLAGAAMLAFPAIGQAHTGHDSIQGLVAGCTHPFTGWDHLLALVAVGIWAAQLGGRARWMVPAVFLGVMACGAAASGSATLPSFTQPMIFSSMLVLGLLIATAVRLPVAASALIVAVFAFFHGAAHGAALPVGTGTVTAAGGFLLAAAGLHSLGLVIGLGAERSSAFVTRLLGAAVALTGLALI